VTLPITDPSIVDLLDGLRELAEAEPGYIEAQQNFENTAPEFFADRKLARKIGESGKRFRVNIAKKPVTTVTDRLEIAAVSVVGNEAATAVLQAQVWDANELALEAPVIHLRACEFGDEYVFLYEGEGPDGEPDGTAIIERSGALSTRIVYDPERPRRPKFGIKAWKVGTKEKKQTRVNLYYPPDDPDGGRIERWISTVGVDRPTDPEHWMHYTVERPSDDDPVGVEVVVDWTDELDRFPIYHFRTSRPYGIPLHFDAYGPQEGLNKLTATMFATTDQHGFPIRYALAESGTSEGDDDADDFGTLDDPIETGVTDLPEDEKRDRAGKLKSGPGQFWWLTGAKGAGQFEPANPDVFLKPADWLVRMSSQATDTPLHMYDPGGDQPSGDSRRAALDTLKNKVSYLSLSFGSTWKRLLADALEIVTGKTHSIDVRWAPFDKIDDAEGWQTVSAKIEAGVPVGQALMEAGYTPEQVEGWLSDSTEQDLRRRVQLLGELAKAARDLGTGVGMGVLPPELVQAVIAGFIPAGDGDAEQS
jgi:hypothetical protein